MLHSLPSYVLPPVVSTLHPQAKAGTAPKVMTVCIFLTSSIWLARVPAGVVNMAFTWTYV